MTTPSDTKKKTKRNRPVDHSPPDKTGKKTREAICPVCNKKIPETTEEGEEPQEAVFCEGDCSTWIHRQCAGLTVTMFTKLGESDSPYKCIYCMLKAQNDEIQQLKDTVKVLSDELAIIKQNKTQQSNYQPDMPSVSLESSSSHGQNSSESSLTYSDTTKTVTQSHQQSAPKTKQMEMARGILPGERKFNLVIHGIAECPKATSRSERQKSDLASCLAIVSKVNADINSHSIRDCLRLGRYNQESSRPRSMLLKLNRSFDVSNVLANRVKTPPGITIKADQTKEERQRESLLLGERWKLMQNGTDKKEIKIRASTIYLKGNKHARVANNCLQYFYSSHQITPAADDSIADQTSTDSVDQMDHNSSEDVQPNTSN